MDDPQYEFGDDDMSQNQVSSDAGELEIFNELYAGISNMFEDAEDEVED